MSVFEQVSVVREANIYFEGKVTSREVRFADGTKKTLGIMLPGEYTFSTGVAEIMEILAGEMVVMLPGESDWQTFSQGQSFNVPASSEFQLKISAVVDYCCSYIEK
nr:pyrimidine/purine nucleoside phosphorylase [uncultured Desulfobulbus sp.]